MDTLNNIIPEKGIINIINYYKKEFEIVDRWGKARFFKDELKRLCDIIDKDLFNVLKYNLKHIYNILLCLQDNLDGHSNYHNNCEYCQHKILQKIFENIKNTDNFNNEVFNKIIHLSKCIDSLI
jgi:DNA-directed RNA polymerase subunit RPC12/RpoP